MVNVTASASSKTGKVYHNVSALMPVPAAMKKTGLPDGFNELGYFSMEDEKPAMQVFESLSQYHQNKVKQSPEWQALFGNGGGNEKNEPFEEDESSRSEENHEIKATRPVRLPDAGGGLGKRCGACSGVGHSTAHRQQDTQWQKQRQC
jgi:hypothetical protein